jgi:hypothetical protein
MAGFARGAVHAQDWKFTTSRREVGWATMLKKISSPSVGNATGRSIVNDIGTNEMFLEQFSPIVIPGALIRLDVRDHRVAQGYQVPVCSSTTGRTVPRDRLSLLQLQQFAFMN